MLRTRRRSRRSRFFTLTYIRPALIHVTPFVVRWSCALQRRRTCRRALTLPHTRTCVRALIKEHAVWRNPGIYRRRRRVWQVGRWPPTNRNDYLRSHNTFLWSLSYFLYDFYLSFFASLPLDLDLWQDQGYRATRVLRNLSWILGHDGWQTPRAKWKARVIK